MESEENKTKKMRKENGYIFCEQIIKFTEGMIMRNTMVLVDECEDYCQKHNRNVYFKKKTCAPWEFQNHSDLTKKLHPKYAELGYLEGNSIMQMMRVASPQGTELEIMVEGDDETAKEMINKLCSILDKDKAYYSRFD